MFQTARIQLTLRYLMIIMSVSIAFSLVIFRGASQEIDRIEQIQQVRILRRMQEVQLIDPHSSPQVMIPAYQDPLFEEETKRRILIFLAFINMGIFIIAGGLGYYLAGKTLFPIQVMVDEQNRFISDASHELRTPLTSLKTMMEVSLRDKQLNLAQAKELIRDNITEVDKLHKLSEYLLALTRYQKKTSSTLSTKISLRTIVEQTIQKIKPLAIGKHVRLASSLENISMRGDTFALTSLCTTVIDNAVKYSLPHTEIAITLTRRNTNAILTVRDQGIGISKKDLPHVFDRFYRANTARTKNGEGGFGLGLSIAKEIAQIHKGSIKIESEIKKGTLVTIELPCFS